MWRSIDTPNFRSVRLQPDVRLVALAIVVAVAGCSSKQESKPAPTYTLRNVTLPDLSHAVPTVQQQLKDGYASLQTKINGTSTPSDELAAAYGQMGMLLMAAEYRAEAESALLNAQTFSPRDPRWPYYLGHLYRLKGDPVNSFASFTHALELQPDDVATLVWVGEGDLDGGRP